MSSGNPALPGVSRLPFYYGWVNLVLASVAMTATLPGRTHGLGLITKPLTEDPALGVGPMLFSTLNFWAILIGALLCFPVGRLIDRFGTRMTLVGVAAGLGASVIAMSRAESVLSLFIALTLVRGLGQGSLSVVSMAMVGKWFTRRLGLAMGIYTVLLAIGFMVTVVGVGAAVQSSGWRPVWSAVGFSLLLGLAPLGWLLVRSTPESLGLAVDQTPTTKVSKASLDMPLGRALRTPAFWAFTLSAALFNLVWSAVTLFNQSILADRGFGEDTFLVVMGVLAVSGLPANLIGGWLAGRWPMGRLLALGMLIFAVALLIFPLLDSTIQLVMFAVALGASGGIITVIFFAVYGHAFGRTELGAIQSVVQVITVLASAAGPVIVTWCKDSLGSYAPLFYASAPLAVALGVAAWLSRLPNATNLAGERNP